MWCAHPTDFGAARTSSPASRPLLAPELAVQDPKRPTSCPISAGCENSGLGGQVPLGFTWTKTDVAVPGDTRETIERARCEFAPTSEVWETTVEDPLTIAKVLSQAISVGANPSVLKILDEPVVSDDPFLAFRGNHARR